MPAARRPSGPPAPASAPASPAAGAARLELILFGPPQVLHDGAAVALPVRKTLALLAYLAIEGRTPRHRLADLLWPDLDESASRRNLRRVLHRLRAAGLGDAIVSDDDHVELGDVVSDLAAFDRALAAGRDEVAESLARRPLLDGLEVDDAPAFVEWLQRRRDQVAKAWRAAATRRAAACEASGDLAEAIALHERLLDAEPLREETWRDLMRLHDARGNRGIALALYARCQALLRDELHLDPLPQTLRLAERIAARGELPAEAAAERAAAAPFDARSIPFVARDRELAALAAHPEAVVLIEGDAGVGKSRLAAEAWARRARERGVAAEAPLRVRFAEMSSSTPFHAVADALRAPGVAARLPDLGRVWRADLARLLPEWGEAGAGAAAATGSAPAEARARLLEALAQALAVGSGGSQMVVFDDVQWADASSVELMVHLAHRHAQAPTVLPRVLATARTAELALNPAAAPAVVALAAEGALARLTLAPFDEWSMLQLVQRLSGRDGGVRFAARLNDATGGNPFFALETMRALIESGELQADPEQGWSTRYDETTTDYAELPLPASVIEAVRSRVARLGPAAVRLVETAALAEDGSTLAELQGATALSDWEALEGIERAMAAHVVAREGDGYRFVHDLVRAAIAGSLGVERRRLTHARLAAALERSDVPAARIAAHWQAAGASGRARKAWLRAADAALALHAHREAASHFERAGDLAEDDEEALTHYDSAVERMMVAALEDDCRRLLQRMLERAERSGVPGRRGRVLLRMAELESHANRYDMAQQLALRADREGGLEDVRFRVHALSTAAFCANMLDRPADALPIYRQALAVAVEGGNRRAEAMMAAAASSVAVQLCRFDEADALGARARAAAAEEPATSLARAQSLSNSTFVLRALGRRAEAECRLREAADIARATHTWHYLPFYLANLCETLIDDGQGDAARRCRDEMEAAPEGRDPHLESFTHGAVAEFAGQLGDAIAAADRAATAAGTDLAARRDALLLGAQVLAAIGAVAQATRQVDEAAALVPADAPGPPLRVICHRAALRLVTDPLGARDSLREALTRAPLERLAAPATEAARILLGRAELALGGADAARRAVDGICHSVALEVDAAIVRLAAARLDGQGVHDAEAVLHLALEGGRLPALNALAVLRVLMPSAGRRGVASWRQRAAAAAQRLADSLRPQPPLQAGFIRLHRDLLT